MKASSVAERNLLLEARLKCMAQRLLTKRGIGTDALLILGLKLRVNTSHRLHFVTVQSVPEEAFPRLRVVWGLIYLSFQCIHIKRLNHEHLIRPTIVRPSYALWVF